MSILEIAHRVGKEFEVSDLGTLCLTPYGEAIVSMVLENPSETPEFEKQFLQMWLEPKKVPHELLTYCMYHLKLPGLRSHIEEYRHIALSQNDWRAEGPTRMILDAYKEPWEDYDLFYE